MINFARKFLKFVIKLKQIHKKEPEMINDVVIKLDDFIKHYPRCKNPIETVDRLNELLPIHNISTVEAVAGFLAQTGHESAGWSTFVENLNYSESALKKLFSKYFRRVPASSYARKPELIANRVYANRMGNGDEIVGDGWKYRGRGPIQLTGYDNYSGFNSFLNSSSYDYDTDIIENPDAITEDIEIQILSAIYFWNREKLSEVCDRGDIKGCTKIINGGYNGLEERTVLFYDWICDLD